MHLSVNSSSGAIGDCNKFPSLTTELCLAPTDLTDGPAVDQDEKQLWQHQEDCLLPAPGCVTDAGPHGVHREGVSRTAFSGIGSGHRESSRPSAR